MKKSTELEIMPDASLWMKLGRTKYTIPKALAELIDNSIDNKLGDKVNVNIYFQIDGDFIGVLDDGKGMSLETLKNALTIAYHKDDNGKIGEYGFGLKAATSYLGKKLTIYTKMQSDKEYLKFFYDENEFIEKNQWKVNVEYIDELKVKEEVGVSFNNGTYILIEDLNVKLYKRLLIILVLAYAIFTLANQQKVLNRYSENSKELAAKIEEQQAYNDELVAEKENVDSKEFIEQMAREKLDMYYPNEKVYLDKGM